MEVRRGEERGGEEGGGGSGQESTAGGPRTERGETNHSHLEALL